MNSQPQGSAGNPVAVRPYQSGDRESVRSLLSKVFGSPEVFDRFSEGNPLGDFVAVVAESDGGIVGFNMWNAWLVHALGGPVTAYQSGASAVDESMRGRGLFRKLLGAGEQLGASRGIRWFFGFPNPSSTEAFLRSGWRRGGTMRVLLSPTPSVGLRRGGSGALLSGPALGSLDTPQARFQHWRYGRAGVASRAERLPDGRAVTVYYRTSIRLGLRLHKLLDVVDQQGQRVTRGLGRILASAPGPGVTLLRATPPPQSAIPWIPVPRSWDTPVIFKCLQGSWDSYSDFAGGSYWYGDIDAS